MFELWNAIKLGRDRCDIQIILAPEDKKAFRDRINADGSDARAIDEALANVKSDEAEAFSQDDLERIHSFIRSLPGGFDTLDSTIKQHLRRWFVSQGGIQVAARQGRAAGRVSQAPPARHPDRVERVDVAQFVVRAPTAAAAMFVNNPVYGGAATTTPPPPMTQSPAPTTSSTVGRSWWSGRRRKTSAAIRRLSPAAGATYEDVLPVASATAPSSVGSRVGTYEEASSAASAGGFPGAASRPGGNFNRRNDAADGGYMAVEATPTRPGESPGRLDSDVALITDTGLGRRGSDVPLITDPFIDSARLASICEL